MDSSPSLSPASATAKRDAMTDAPRPEARSPRGFVDRRARDLVAERKILAAVSEVYERYGFEAVGRYDFMVGSHVDEDIVLRHVVMDLPA